MSLVNDSTSSSSSTAISAVFSSVGKPLLTSKFDANVRDLAGPLFEAFTNNPSVINNWIGSSKHANLVDAVVKVIDAFIVFRYDDSATVSTANEWVNRLVTTVGAQRLDMDVAGDQNHDQRDIAFKEMAVCIALIITKFIRQQRSIGNDVIFNTMNVSLGAALDSDFESNPSLGSSVALDRLTWLYTRAILTYVWRFRAVRTSETVFVPDFEDFEHLVVNVDISSPEDIDV